MEKKKDKQDKRGAVKIEEDTLKLLNRIKRATGVPLQVYVNRVLKNVALSDPALKKEAK